MPRVARFARHPRRFHDYDNDTIIAHDDDDDDGEDDKTDDEPEWRSI